MIDCWSVAKLCPTLQPHELQHVRLPRPPLSSWYSCPLMESVMPSNHLILCCPLLLLPSISPTIRVFFNESALCIKWLLEFQHQHMLGNKFSSQVNSILSNLNWSNFLQVLVGTVCGFWCHELCCAWLTITVSSVVTLTLQRKMSLEGMWEHDSRESYRVQPTVRGINI